LKSFTRWRRSRAKAKYLHRVAVRNLLPREILEKPKQGGFVPLRVFLRDESLRQRIYRHLLESKLIQAHFRPDYLKSLFEIYERAESRSGYWYNYYSTKVNRILFLLVFDIWHKQFVENGSLSSPSTNLRDYL